MFLSNRSAASERIAVGRMLLCVSCDLVGGFPDHHSTSYWFCALGELGFVSDHPLLPMETGEL